MVSVENPYTPEQQAKDGEKFLNGGILGSFSEVLSAIKGEETDTRLGAIIKETIHGVESENSETNALSKLIKDFDFGNIFNSILGLIGLNREARAKLSAEVEGNNANTIGSLDLAQQYGRYKNDAGVKNNNPAGLTYSSTFARTLKNTGIAFLNGSDRPDNEGGSYFKFPNVEAGMMAFNKLWDIKLKKFSDGKVADIVKDWAVDYSSYEGKLGDYWNRSISSLSESDINTIQMAQIKIESPGFYKEIQKNGLIPEIERTNFA